MRAYSGFLTVMGGLFLAAALVFLVLTYITKYPGYVTLGVVAAALFIRWAMRFFKEEEPEVRRTTKWNTDQKTDREFDAWMSLNDK